MDLLQCYMLNSDNIAKFKLSRLDFKNNIPIYKNEPKKKITYFKPKYDDSLFWCFYIIYNGFEEYF